MGIFRRRHSDRGAGGGPNEPVPGLPMFDDGERAVRFSSLAREVFAEHGIECTYADGYLRGTDGRTYGLTNVALQATHEPERGWRDLLAQHVGSIVAAHAMPRERDMDAVRHRLYLRLWSTEELPSRPHAAEPLGDGLTGLAALDHPEHIETLTGATDIDLLGGWPAVRAVALDNLSRLRSDEIVPLGDDPASRVQLSVGGFFNASRVFTMGHLLREDFLLENPSYGVLFAVPNRHLVAVHPVEGAGLVGATSTLTRLAHGESRSPGTISSQVWFWRDGTVQQVTRPGPEPDSVEMRVEGALEETMRELGLIGDL